MSHQTHTPAWAVGMQKLLPGFYVDAAGALHIDEREVCEHAGVPYTERNAQVIADYYGLPPSRVVEIGTRLVTSSITSLGQGLDYQGASEP